MRFPYKIICWLMGHHWMINDTQAPDTCLRCGDTKVEDDPE